MVEEDDPPGQGNAIRAVKQGVNVSLEFVGAPASGWRVYADVDKTQLGTTLLPPDVFVSTFVDIGAVPAPPDLRFYQIIGLSLCSHSPGPP